MGDVIPITNAMNHHVAELICLRCRDRGDHTWPCGVALRDLQCGGCGAAGFLIVTGEMRRGEPDGPCPLSNHSEGA